MKIIKKEVKRIMIKRDVSDKIHELSLESIRLRDAAWGANAKQADKIREHQDKLWKQYTFLKELIKATNKLRREELEKEKKNERKNSRSI